jgi:predicted secreted hydrolase
VNLPEDEGAHGTPIEWWYFNGHLADDSGGRYSYHFVAFQTHRPGGAAAQLLQLSWADHDRSLHFTSENATLPDLSGPAAAGSFDVRASGWRMFGDGRDYLLAFAAGGYSLDLSAVSAKPAALHQGTGLVDLGPAGETFYYSRTRLNVAGALTLEGQLRPVTGIAWMDHQWGEFSSRRVGWDWVSLQFDDQSELMAVLVWDSEDRQPFASYGTFVAPDGAAQAVDSNNIALTATGAWTSPATGVAYPMGWELSIPSLGLELTLAPAQNDAEFAGSRFVPAPYWEGAVSIVGVKEGAAITGRGVVELVGYGPSAVKD